MAEKTKKSFFETGIMRSRIKSRTVSLFPEAGLGYLLGPILALVGNGVINIWLIQYWDKVLGLGTWNPLFEILLPLISGHKGVSLQNLCLHALLLQNISYHPCNAHPPKSSITS